MKAGQWILAILVLLAIAVIPADVFYASRFVPRFKELEKQRIVTSNQLATAKIVSENLEHVRELVFRNMDFPGQKEGPSQESIIFEFLTSCVNDLKMKLVSVQPIRPTVDGRVTTYGYDIQLEGDFFSLGELCAKLENSQRVLALTSFAVAQQAEEAADAKAKPLAGRRGISIRLHLDTFRLR
jgi:hypothetical protein